MPIFFPIITNLGFDPIWFGIIVVMVVELGLITPPIGIERFCHQRHGSGCQAVFDLQRGYPVCDRAIDF